MHMDPVLPTLVTAAFFILAIGAMFRKMAQPHVVGYLIAGVVLGPDGLAVFVDSVALGRMGEIGVIFLLFFVGMEVDLQKLVSGWRVPVIGTALQVAGSVGCVGLIGWLFHWPLERSLLLGFVISLSSTTLVISMLRQWDELDTPASLDAIGILLAQDVAVVGMMLGIGFMSGEAISASQLGIQAAGSVLVLLFATYLVRAKVIQLPFGGLLRGDGETQVFAGFLLCFGFAMLTGLMGLSTALGAFLAGLVVTAARETKWVHQVLEPFRVVFVALFFVSVGMLMDIGFLREHWVSVLALTFVALFVNTALNAGILRALGRGWGTSLYVGALLSQIGEFSFVLASVGKQAGIIGDFAYQGTIGVIALSIVLNPLWIMVVRPRRGPSARVDGAASPSTT
ncbi:Glutathione-regulated potassium-efflux system protein KefC [Planctomycetes bacterium Poly30]|uniref:Glutathione-regulated potassium-efflux system protein KefC n=1 Tax=Saltatorellus ferox TaxID=2528018 RepID=A0A518EYK4_9BACT|nr:Glutathione-regulated potassium-efflux system protein KefC [Planctomycetes bacterium Poly30]